MEPVKNIDTLLAKLKSQGAMTSGTLAKQMWQLTGLGHQRFRDRHADLTLQLLDSVNSVFGAQGLVQLIAVREQQMLNRYQTALSTCKTLASKVSALALIRSDEGYIASVEKISAQHYLLIESHCPICAAASQCQSLCRSELAIFQQCLGEKYIVQRSEYLLTGDRRCSYKISVND